MSSYEAEYRATVERFNLIAPQRTKLDSSPAYAVIMRAAGDSQWETVEALLTSHGILPDPTVQLPLIASRYDLDVIQRIVLHSLDRRDAMSLATSASNGRWRRVEDLLEAFGVCTLAHIQLAKV